VQKPMRGWTAYATKFLQLAMGLYGALE